MKKMNSNKVCVIGLGYIGLPTAAILANNGYSVCGVDINESVVKIINNGQIHIIEPELDKLVESTVNSANLFAKGKPVESDVFLIAVPTPFKNNYEPNIDFVINATISLIEVLKPGNLIILESTSPIGTTELILETLINNNVDTSEIFIAHCPERVLPGNIIFELIHNDRIVGGINYNSSNKAKQFYQTFVKGEVIITDSRTAELCKLVENSFRDVNIAFANELSIICNRANINVWDLINLANRHPRVNILKPGVGVGGHCIAVDPWFIVSQFPNDSKLIKQARTSNINKTDWVVENIRGIIKNFKLKNAISPKVALLGLSFKPDIDDLRESPALLISSLLSDEFRNNQDFMFIEPNLTKHDFIKLTELNDLHISNIDIVVYLVSHKLFKNLKFSNEIMILDYCGII